MSRSTRVRRSSFALATAFLTLGAFSGSPASATGRSGNADTVDGFRAVACSTPVASRGGVLVATCQNGFLPNNIIVMARNSKKLSGKTLAQVLALAGDIKSVNAGTGLVGGGTSGDVTVSIAPAFQLPQSCSNGQVPKSNGSNAWVCGQDDNTTTFWSLTGNAGTSSSNFLGTTDNQPLIIKVDGQRAMRYQPSACSTPPCTPNLIGGFAGNAANAGVQGASIGGGGGAPECGIPPCTNGVTGDFGTVSGGDDNFAGNEGFVGGGNHNFAAGQDSMVPGGFGNQATGSRSFAAGTFAMADDGGSFVWSDNDSHTFHSAGFNSFNVKAEGGVRFVTARTVADTYPNICSMSASAGWNCTAAADNGLQGNTSSASLSGGGVVGVNSGDGIGVLGQLTSTSLGFAAVEGDAGSSVGWAGYFKGNVHVTGDLSANTITPSDRTIKREFAVVNDQAILRKVARLPISSWSYRSDPRSVRHVGPMAQDFWRIFRLGSTNKGIAVVDGEGVSLAAIKALYGRAVEMRARLRGQVTTIAKLRRENRRLAHGQARQAREIAALDRAVKRLEGRSSR